MAAIWKWRPYQRVFPPHLGAGVDDELRFHLNERVEELVTAGASDDAARAQALAEFGDVDRVRAGLLVFDRRTERRRRRTEWIESLWADIRYALRTLVQAPRFTAAALATLALGVGISSMVVGAIDAVLLRPLPYRQPDQLVALWEMESKGERYSVAFASLRDLERHADAFSGLAGSSLRAQNLSGRGQPQRVWVDVVSAPFFDLLGVQAFLGRTFRADEGVTGRNRVAVVSHGLWQQLGSPADLVGSVIRIDDVPHEVIGVAPEAFQPPDEFGRRDPVALYVPIASDDPALAADNHGDHELNVIGRLAPGVSLVRAQASVDRVWAWLAKTYPDSNKNVTGRLAPLGADLVRDVRQSMLVLVGAVALLWLVACVNLATLLLVRAVGRQREISVRAALGASRGRIVQMLVVQCSLVALAGCAIGLGLGSGMLRIFASLVPADVPRAHEMGIDGRVIAVMTGLSLVAAVGFGLFPAWSISRAAVSDTLRASERNMVSASAVRWRSGLVMAEIALSLVLLTGSGLLLRSFATLAGVDLGFLTDHVLTMRIELPESRYATADARLRFFEQLSDRVHGFTGVEAVGFANRYPLRGGWSGGLLIGERQQPVEVDLQAVSTEYFRTLGIPVLRGRRFESTDRADTVPVAVVNARFASTYFPGRDAVGQQIRRHEEAPMLTIVGVVGDVRRAGKAAAALPGVYLPATQTALYPVRLADFAVRCRDDPYTLVAAIRDAVFSIDREQPIGNVRTLSEAVGESLAQRRFEVGLVALFAAAALALTLVGVYGVASYATSQRTVEFGVRMALGAGPGDIIRLVLSQSGALICGGLVIGLTGALIFARSMSSLLYEVQPHDPATLATVSVLLTIVTMVASYLPARRAARIDPTRALRAE